VRPVGIGRVAEADLGGADATCRLCGFAGERPREVLLQRDPDVWMLACPQCHASSAERLPRRDALAKLYDPAVYTSDLVASDASSARCARHVVARLDVPAYADLELLDYGGNDGALSHAILEALRRRGHRGRLRATVVDIYVRPPRGDVRFVHVDDFAHAPDRYDVLLASAVLEHLPDVRDVVRRIAAAARPGALFWARSPYDVPLARLGLGLPVMWPRHLHDMGPAFWSRALEVFGVEGELIESAPSIVQTDLRRAPLRTLAAHALKWPARVERRLRGRGAMSPSLAWRWIGGWEVFARIDGVRA